MVLKSYTNIFGKKTSTSLSAEPTLISGYASKFSFSSPKQWLRWLRLYTFIFRPKIVASLASLATLLNVHFSFQSSGFAGYALHFHFPSQSSGFTGYASKFSFSCPKQWLRWLLVAFSFSTPSHFALREWVINALLVKYDPLNKSSKSPTMSRCPSVYCLIIINVLL